VRPREQVQRPRSSRGRDQVAAARLRAFVALAERQLVTEAARAPKRPGHYTLLARAKDAGGRLQPDKHDQNYGAYVIDYSLPIEVFVEDTAGP
jgi:hypothetical protein